MRAAVGVYGIIVGVLMVGWWANDLRGGVWNRGDRTHAEMALHLAAEFLTAGWLIASGILVLTVGERAEPFLGVGLGMLLYTVIVSPGYFLARGELPVVGMFAVLVALTVAGLAVLLA